MDYLNLHSSTLDSAEFIGSEPNQRATWLCLLRYCIGQENSGRIDSCREWSDWKWQQLCRVKLREISAKSDLWNWDGNTLVVWAYPIDQQNAVQANRTNGRKGGRPVKNPTETQEITLGLLPTIPTETEAKPPGFSPDNQTVPIRQNVKERKGKKGKEKEGNIPRRRGGGALGFSLSEQREDVRLRMMSINALKNRQASTVWTSKEFAAFQAAGLETMPDDDFNEQFTPVAAFYAAEVGELRSFWRAKDPNADFRRRDLLTLLNNWAGEVDRAREWCHWRQKKNEDGGRGRL